ncbi:MAG: MFS transporter [bacterium]
MNKKASLSIIFGTVFIDLLGFGILIPILPIFASKQLHISDFQIGMIVAIFSLVQFLFNPILGKVSDKIGRRPIIVITLLITSVSYIMFSFAHTFWMLFLSRLLAGFGGSNIGVAQAYIADITSKEERAKGMGMIGAAFGLGFLFGPMIGGFLSQYGYEYASYGSAAFSFIAFVFAFFFLPESKKILTEKTDMNYKIIDFRFAKETLKHPTIGLLIFVFFLLVFSMANIYGTFPLIGSKFYHFSNKDIIYLYVIMGLMGAIIQGGLMRYLTQKISEVKLVMFGMVCLTIGLGLIPYGINYTGVVVAIIILSIGNGILQPVVISMISKYSPEHNQGETLGFSQSLSALGRVFGPLWGGFAYDFIGYQAPFLTGCVISFIALLLGAKMLTKLERK